MRIGAICSSTCSNNPYDAGIGAAPAVSDVNAVRVLVLAAVLIEEHRYLVLPHTSSIENNDNKDNDNNDNDNKDNDNKDNDNKDNDNNDNDNKDNNDGHNVNEGNDNEDNSNDTIFVILWSEHSFSWWR